MTSQLSHCSVLEIGLNFFIIYYFEILREMCYTISYNIYKVSQALPLEKAVLFKYL